MSDKKCPLFLMTPDVGTEDCMGKNCAWFDKIEEECSILAIAHHLWFTLVAQTCPRAKDKMREAKRKKAKTPHPCRKTENCP